MFKKFIKSVVDCCFYLINIFGPSLFCPHYTFISVLHFFSKRHFCTFFEPPFALKFSIFLHFFSKRTNCIYFRNATFLDNEIAPFFETPRCTFFRNDNAPLSIIVVRNEQKSKTRVLYTILSGA